MTRRSGSRRLGPVLVSAASALLLIFATTACEAIGLSADGGRSVEKYCATMAQHKDRFESAMTEATATENLFAGTAGALAAIGDLNTMWTDLAKVSPGEITTDVETVRDYWSSSYDKAADNVSKPLGGLSSALLGGFKVAGPMQRVNDYTAQQCPEVGAPFLQTGT